MAGEKEKCDSVAEEFVIDEDFGAVGIRGNSDCADAIRDGQHSRNKAAKKVSSQPEAMRGPEDEPVYKLIYIVKYINR